VKWCRRCDGIKIDESDEHCENTDLSITDNRESDSTLITERFAHFPKQFAQTVSTEEGIQIDERDEHFEKANDPIRDSFESASNVTVVRLQQSLKHSSPIV
jgi:hypothetical protein